MQRISKGAIAIILLLIIALLGVGAVGYLSKGFQNWSYKEWFSKDIKDPIIDAGKDSNKSSALVTDGDGNELVSGVVYDLPSSIVFNGVTGKKTSTALYSDDDVSTVADDDGGILLQAIIKPDYAIDKSVDWSVSWAETSDSDSIKWVEGKNVSDYLSIIPNSDGSTIAKLYCTERFGAQAQITVTSRRNPNATRTCKIDMRRSYDGSLRFYDVATKDYDSYNNSPKIYLGDSDPVITLDFNKLYLLDYNAFKQVGSINPEVLSSTSSVAFLSPTHRDYSKSLRCTIKISDELYNYLTSKFTPVSDRVLDKNLSISYQSGISIGANGVLKADGLMLKSKVDNNSITIDVLNRFQDLFFETRSTDNIVSIVEALKLYSGVTLELTYRSGELDLSDIYYQTISIKFDPSTITLDPSDIEFPDIVLP